MSVKLKHRTLMKEFVPLEREAKNPLQVEMSLLTFNDCWQRTQLADVWKGLIALLSPLPKFSNLTYENGATFALERIIS